MPVAIMAIAIPTLLGNIENAVNCLGKLDFRKEEVRLLNRTQTCCRKNLPFPYNLFVLQTFGSLDFVSKLKRDPSTTFL
jgi:hypothetical protein